MRGQERKELGDFLGSHVLWVFHAVMANELDDPVPVGFFGASAEVAEAYLAVKDFEKFGLTGLARAASVHAFRPMDLVRLARRPCLASC